MWKKEILFFLSLFLFSYKSHSFEWPKEGELNKENVHHYVEAYAKAAKVCLNPTRSNADEKKWTKEIKKDQRKILREKRKELDRDVQSDDHLQKNRNSYCPNVATLLGEKDKTLDHLYGNCGEGREVNYCLLHQAGMKRILACDNRENDHTLILFWKKVVGQDGIERKTLCLADRFPLINNKHVICGIRMYQGVIMHPVAIDGRKYEKKWLRNFECYDPLNSNIKNLTSLDEDSWPDTIPAYKSPVETKLLLDGGDYWEGKISKPLDRGVNCIMQ